MKKIIGTLLLLAALCNAYALPSADSLKPYKEIVPATAVTGKSFITVHQVNNRYLFEIPDSILGRDLFTVNRIIQSPQDWRNPFSGLCSYGNDWIGQSMFRFRRAENNRIMLQVVSTSERTSGNDLSASLERNNTDPLYAIFPVLAKSPEGAWVIDMTDFLNSDNSVFGYMAAIKMLAMPGTFAADRSFLNSVKAFPANIEIASTRSYSAGNTTLTGLYNSSLILLPKEPMKGRLTDERVGFFGIVPTDFRQWNDDGTVKTAANIWRWKLEPRKEDMEKYFRGELVEPEKPIVFYIDPATPKKWVPYLVAGVNDWQAAFEKAGFRNAIFAKEVPEGDTTFDINDARHNVIVYKASAIGNAMGHSLQDPRSGEIIESHIQWYHSVQEILYKWYLTQAGAVDTAAQKPYFSDELMGQLIRFVSSHEVGHAVGLRHNWGASSTTTIAQLRDKKWVEANGHTPSIMDYARFNYVAQPEDSIGEAGLFPRIGDYDKWAVEWGYKLLPPGTAAGAEAPILDKWIVDKLKESKRFRFGIGDDPSAKFPDNQREDMGDDAMEAGKYGIKNLQRIAPQLFNWVQTPGATYSRVEDVYKALVAQYEWYIKHVTANVGGVQFTPLTTSQDGDVYAFFPRSKQRRAVEFLNKELFATPEWLRNRRLYELTTTDFTIVTDLQKRTLKQLMDAKEFDKFREAQISGDADVYQAGDLLNDLYKGIFEELQSGADISPERRALQRAYVSNLLGLLEEYKDKEQDAGSVVKDHAKQVMAACKAVANKIANQGNKLHLGPLAEMLSARLEKPMEMAKQRASQMQ